MKRLLEKANWITLMLCVGVIQVSAYYLLSATVRPDGLLAVAQPDTSLYFQAARRVAEGGAFTFSAGGSVNTGTTSVLYPLVLAAPYALGLRGGSLVGVGFLLNAAFYLAFLLCWAQVIAVKVRTPASQAASGLLLALIGQFAFVSVAQSDTGLWLAVSSLFALGLARDKPWLWGAVLLVAPWVRPEGVVCVIAVTLVSLAVRRYRTVAALGLLSVLGVFLLNRCLTGTWQFTSVQGKGHFVTEPFALAAVSSFKDAVAMFRQLFLGMPSGSFREMFFCPVLGAVCLWYHVFRRDYSTFDAREAVFLLAAAGGFATVAMSGWQGTNFDRYLAWILPIAVIWTACGAVEIGARLAGVARFLPLALMLFFGLVAAVASSLWFRMGCEETEIVRAFAERCEGALPAGASLGSYGHSNCAYWLSPRRFDHLSGIYSPEYAARNPVSALETVKHDSRGRFDYWLYDAAIEGALVPDSAGAVFGEMVFAGPMGLELRKADWTPFEAACAVPPPPDSGLCLKASLDVGYEADERAADYRTHGVFLQSAPEPVFRLDELGGKKLAEVGRVVTGGDEMTVSGLEPGKDLFVVMRTALGQRAVTLGSSGRRTDDYSFVAKQSLTASVDGVEAGSVGYEVPEKGFADVSFKIPGSAVAASTVRLTLAGGHVSFAYWFYQ